MKKMWLLGSASLLICAGVAVCNVQASSVTPSDQAIPAQSPQAGSDVAVALSTSTGSNRVSSDIFSIPSASLPSHAFDSSIAHESGSVSEKSFILLLSAVAAFCLLRRRDIAQEERMTQRQSRPATLWSRHWTTQPSQDSV